jgi:protein SCO1
MLHVTPRMRADMARIYKICTVLKSRGFLAALFAVLFFIVATKMLLDNSPSLATLAAPAATAGDFELTDKNGQHVTEKDLLGKPSALFFGYTHCPSICPTTLFELATWLKALRSDAAKLNVVFISVDSKRDTPEILKLYLSSFDPRIRGFTGTAQQIEKITSEYHVYYKRIQLDGGDYAYDHSALIRLIDGNGHYIGTITPKDSDPAALTKLRQLIKGG